MVSMVKYTMLWEGSIFIAGSVVQWFRDSMRMVTTLPESEELARKSTSNDEVYVVPAFTGLELRIGIQMRVFLFFD